VKTQTVWRDSPRFSAKKPQKIVTKQALDQRVVGDELMGTSEAHNQMSGDLDDLVTAWLNRVRSFLISSLHVHKGLIVSHFYCTGRFVVSILLQPVSQFLQEP
jgi:hypothetical protein